LLKKAARTDADALILDLEDSVQPLCNKQLARDCIQAFLESSAKPDKSIFIRVNDLSSGHLLRDLLCLTLPAVDGFVYPKSKVAADVYSFDQLLTAVELHKNLEVGTFKIIPLIETTNAVTNVSSICAASPRVIAVAYGCEDYVADLGGVNDKAGVCLSVPRALIAMAAKANNVLPIDTVHVRLHDLDDLRMNLTISKTLGYEGMLVLHPKELAAVNETFSPSESEVAAARELLRLYAEAQASGKGVVYVNNTFVGPPLVLAAEKLLDKHQALRPKGADR
jgi:citrate lyase subunit beta/citryl-CoA lyase